MFAETDERRDRSFVSAGAGVRIERRGTKAGHLYDLLGHSLGGAIGVEPYLITLAEDAVPYTHFRHAGIEFLYMLSGKVWYRHGDRTYLMEPGDALFFDAAARHGPEKLVDMPMRYLSISSIRVKSRRPADLKSAMFSSENFTKSQHWRDGQIG